MKKQKDPIESSIMITLQDRCAACGQPAEGGYYSISINPEIPLCNACGGSAGLVPILEKDEPKNPKNPKSYD